MRKSETFINIEVQVSQKVDNKTIKGVIENPHGNTLVILVHGFTGDWRGPEDIYKKLSLQLQKKNHAVLRFSFLGTPRSEGKYRDMTVQSQTDELNAVIKHAKKLGYTDIVLVGESMGGTIAALSYDDFVKAVVFWYSAFDFADSDFSMFFTDTAKKDLVENGHVMCDGYEVGEKFIKEISSINVYDKLKDIKFPFKPHTQTQHPFDFPAPSSRQQLNLPYTYALVL